MSCIIMRNVTRNYRNVTCPSNPRHNQVDLLGDNKFWVQGQSSGGGLVAKPVEAERFCIFWKVFLLNKNGGGGLLADVRYRLRRLFNYMRYLYIMWSRRSP